MLKIKKTAIIGILALSMTGMHAMAPVLTLQKYDLQKEFGYKHYAKRHGEAKAHVDYLGKLQILANALLIQEQLIDGTYEHVDTLMAQEKAYKIRAQFIPDDTQADDNGQGSYTFYPKTAEALAIGLRYRDLLSNPSLALELQKETILALFTALRKHSDPDVQYLGKVIGGNYMVNTATVKHKTATENLGKTIKLAENLYNVHLYDLIKRVNEKNQTASDTFILRSVKALVDLLTQAAKKRDFDEQYIARFQATRDVFTAAKNTGTQLYQNVIAEMNSFIQQNPDTYSAYAYHLEQPSKLLPGINETILSAHTQSQDTFEKLMTEIEAQNASAQIKKSAQKKNQPTTADQSTLAPSINPTVPEEKTETKQTAYLNTDTPFQAAQNAPTASRSYTFAEPCAGATIGKTAEQATKTAHLTPLSADEPLFKDFNGKHGSLLRVYTSLARNNANVPQFALASNVAQWLDNPQQALKDQRYYCETLADQALKNKGHSKYKYARAKAYYEKKYTDNNDDTLRMHMHIFHALPREIDACIQRYGQVKEQSSKQPRNQTHICITLPGEVIFADGNRQQGLFSYVINKENNVCFHRMFEPKELSTQILNPALLDLDMNTVDE